MRAIWTTGTSGPDSLEVRETEDPEPGPGQVRIRVRAAGLCFAEVMAAQGLYPDAPKFPAVLGYEAAGVIDKAGEGVDERREGSHVIALARYGAHSDVVCVPANQAFAIPPHKDFTEAAAIPVEERLLYLKQLDAR
jgi:NADPH:quinone reductase-like Zn-dependent oxidoreductase